MSILYFAYGSNLNKKQMREECPSSRPYTTHILKDHRLVFRKTADIIPAQGFNVYGALYVIDAKCRKSLDHYENSPKDYKEETIDTDAGPAIVFDMEDKTSLIRPNASYLSKIRQGYHDWLIPMYSLHEAVRYTLNGEE